MSRGTLGHRILTALGGVVLAAAGVVGAATPARAAACSGSNGVTVVIQSEAGTSTRCAAGDPGSALGALQSVASVTQVSTQPGFVCQINDYPNTSCTRTPPASAYWAFFHAPAGGSWTYSSSGAGSYDPKPGSSVGFRFGSGSAPSVRPAAPAPKPTTAAPKPTTAAPRPTTAAPEGTTAPRATAPPADRAAGTTTPVPTTASRRAATAPASGSTPVPSSPNGGPTAPAGPAASATPSPSESSSPTLEALRAPDPPGTRAGSSGRLVGGGVLLLALASAVAAVALRRRAAGA